MITGREDLMQALIEAFLMEKGTKDFYLQADARAKNQVAKKVFRELSEWEEQHMEFIQSLYLSVQGDRDIESFEQFKNKAEAPVTEAGIPIKDLNRKLEKYDFADDKGALNLALEIEAKAYNLYRKLSEHAADANARIVLREMMEQEAKHIAYLKEMTVKLA